MKRILPLLLAFWLTILPAIADGPPIGVVQPGNQAPSGFAPFIEAGAIDPSTPNAYKLQVDTTNLSLTQGSPGGNITVGVNTIQLNKGGTGATTQQGAVNSILNFAGIATGDLIKYDGVNWSRFPRGTANQVLQMNAGGTDFAWSSNGSIPNASANFILNAADATMPNAGVLTNGTGITHSFVAGGAATISVDGTVLTNTSTNSAVTNKTFTSPGFTWNAGQGVTLQGSTFNEVLKWADPTVGNLGVISFPNPANTTQNVVLDNITQTLAGNYTFSNAPKLTSNTILSSTGNTITVPNATDTLVNLNSTQTLTNKTETSLKLNTSFILQGGSGTTVTWASPGAPRAYSIPDTGVTSTFALLTGTSPSMAAGKVPYTDGNALGLTSVGSNGQVLTSTGAGAPIWANAGGGVSPGGLTAAPPTPIAFNSYAVLPLQPLLYCGSGDTTTTIAIINSLGTGSAANELCVGPRDIIWGTENAATARIFTLGINGTITESSTGLTKGNAFGICMGPDKKAWGTEIGGTGAIWTAAYSAGPGAATEYTTGLTASNSPLNICAGPDGNLWFTENGATPKIGKITTAGTITEYSTGITGSALWGICAGPDGNLWFTESGGTGAIGKITTAGVVTEYTAGLTASNAPKGICAGPDGNMWFTETGATGKIGKISASGTITEYTAAGGTVTQPICVGPDGNIYFFGGGAMYYITTAGNQFTVSAGGGLASATGLCTHRDGAIYMVNSGTGISRLNFVTHISSPSFSGPNIASGGALALDSIGAVKTLTGINSAVYTDGSGNAVAGTLPVVAGGTNATSLTGNGVVIMNGAGTQMTTVAPGSNGNVLTSNGTNWVSQAASGGIAFGGDGSDGAKTISANTTETTVKQFNTTNYTVQSTFVHTLKSGTVINASGTVSISGTVANAQDIPGNAASTGSGLPAASGPAGGYNGGSASAGGGGGGSAGAGGNGSAATPTPGGSAQVYTASITGSGGGSGSAQAGGNGAGRVVICAKGNITIAAGGAVTATGAASAASSTASVSGGGGGSGGVILLASQGQVSNAGTIQANGGNAGAMNGTSARGGGGGGGGWIIYWSTTAPSNTGTNTVTGGTAIGSSNNGTAGGAGQLLSFTGTPNFPLIGWVLDEGGAWQLAAIPTNTPNRHDLKQPTIAAFAAKGDIVKYFAYMSDSFDTSCEAIGDAVVLDPAA